MLRSNTMEQRNMFLTIIIAIVMGGSAGMVGSVYRLILAYEPVMSWWFKFGARFEKKWFFAPVWGCQLCISGQMGLWSYLFLCIMPIVGTQHGIFWALCAPVMVVVQNIVSMIFGLLISICGAILTAKLLTPVLTK